MDDIDLSTLSNRSAASDDQRVTQWLGDFEAALGAGDASAVAALFEADSHWRDLLAFTWDITPTIGVTRIASGLVAAQPAVRARGFAIDTNRTAPRRVRRLGVDVLEAMFGFETEVGRGNGVVRLVPGDGGGLRAWVLLTTLEELKGHEEHVGKRRPTGDAYSRNFGGENWLDQRIKAREYADRDPAVLVVRG
jgi:hypothetical protein